MRRLSVLVIAATLALGGRSTRAATGADGDPSRAPTPTATASAASTDPAEQSSARQLRPPPPGHEAPCPRTSFTEFDLAVALARGHVDRFGAEPPPRRLVGVWAVAAQETSRGERAYAFNLGNIVPVGSQAACLHPTVRDADGKLLRLRMFSSPTEGAAALWAAMGPLRGQVFQHLDVRQWAAFADDLADRGFFEASRPLYHQAIPRLAGAALGSVLPALQAACDAQHSTFSRLPLRVAFGRSAPPLPQGTP